MQPILLLPTRVIAHLDMDAFYASVELLRYPELRGQAVVIGGSSRHQPTWGQDEQGAPRRQFETLRRYSGRGVVTTATYEARALGVHSAMGMLKAAQLAPDAVLLPADFEQYRHYSRLFKAAVRVLAPQIEDRGIDEIYIDLTSLVTARLEIDAGSTALTQQPAIADRLAEVWWCARELARELKQAVHEATGLSCSIGVAPNKLLAKMASELDKPSGLTIITEQDIQTRIWALPVRRINGIGPKAGAKLAQLGIRLIGELAAADPALLRGSFGPSYSAWLLAAAQGRDEREVKTQSEPKSISRETTFERDLHAVRDRMELSTVFTELCSRLARDLQRKHYAGRTVGIKLRFNDFKTVTRDFTLPVATQDATVIRRAAGQCLKRVELTRRIRLLGVRVGSLVHVDDSSSLANPVVTPALVQPPNTTDTSH